MKRGSCPSWRKLRATKWALKHTSISTMQDGNALNVSTRAGRLILRRKSQIFVAIAPLLNHQVHSGSFLPEEPVKNSPPFHLSFLAAEVDQHLNDEPVWGSTSAQPAR
jgi:hypothetical protein